MLPGNPTNHDGGPAATESAASGAPALTVGERRPGVGDVLIAGALAAVAALLLRIVLNVPTPAEVYGDRLTVLLPLPLFSTLLGLFGPSAKHLYFVGLIVAEWLCTSLAGLVYLELRAALDRRWAAIPPRLGVLDIIALPVWLWVLSAGLLAPIIGGGIVGASLTGGVAGTALAQVAPDLVFAAVLLWMSRPIRVTRASRNQSAGGGMVSRRRLLRQSGTALAIVAGGALAWEAVSSGLASLFGLSRPQVASMHLADVPVKIVPPPVPVYGSWASVSGLSPEVASAANFYYVSKNLVGDPRITSSSWQLEITGLVDTPYTLPYDALLSLPRVEQYHTLECISNVVGGNLISNALFTGTRLADLLNHAGIKAGASELVFRAADGYSDTLHLSQALNPDALVVYLLNGEPLPQAHGFPARLLIPGLYGMKNGKWLNSLELGPGGYNGYWEQQGWTREARVKLMSRIDVPHEGDLLTTRPAYIAGIAYSSDHGIARVDVSTDSGQTWSQATLRRPLGSLTWVLWEYLWAPTAGHTQIVVRTIDLQGNVQTPGYADPLPDGASGYHAVNVTVG